LKTALACREATIPHYFVLCKQKAKLNQDVEEFYIHIVFYQSAPLNQAGQVFPPEKK